MSVTGYPWRSSCHTARRRTAASSLWSKGRRAAVVVWHAVAQRTGQTHQQGTGPRRNHPLLAEPMREMLELCGRIRVPRVHSPPVSTGPARSAGGAGPTGSAPISASPRARAAPARGRTRASGGPPTERRPPSPRCPPRRPHGRSARRPTPFRGASSGPPGPPAVRQSPPPGPRPGHPGSRCRPESCGSSAAERRREWVRRGFDRPDAVAEQGRGVVPPRQGSADRPPGCPRDVGQHAAARDVRPSRRPRVPNPFGRTSFCV